MKKLLIGALLLSALASCKKDELIKPEPQKLPFDKTKKLM